jgi:hypothetical protein
MAASTYFNQVQQLYIAYFGRPADPVGLNYWAASIDAAGGNFDSVVSGFSSSLESKALYAGSNTSQLVTSIYVALFNRPPEPAGLAYWVGLIDSNTVTGPRAAYQIMTSAGPGDATAIANKVAAANAFTANIDTSAELAGYSGASSAAIARAWLAKVDATPYSIANLTSDATKGVTDATGVQLGVPTTPTGPSFTATKDGSNVVTLTNAGIGTIGVSVTEVGGVYTFTNSGAVAGSATVVGPISRIILSPSNASLTITSSLADGIIFSNGTIRLSDTTAQTATLLTRLEQTSPALIDATHIPGITAATDAQALALLVTNNGNSGNKIWTAPDVAVTLTSGSSLGATLKSIDDATTGLVDGTSLGTINSATVAQAKQLLVTGNGTAFTHSANVAVVLTDLSANAADLNQINASTTGSISTSLNNLSGTAGDVKLALEAITVGTQMSASSLNAVTLTTDISSADLNNVVFNNNTTINLANVTGNYLVLVDGTVGAGKTLTIDGSTTASTVVIDARAESNGNVILIGGPGVSTYYGSQGADTMTGGADRDEFIFYASNRSTLAAMDNITDFSATTGANAGARDIINIVDIATVASNATTVQDMSNEVSLENALNSMSNLMTIDNGLGVFIWGGNTYAYVETTGATTSYVAGDTLIKLGGTPFAAGTNIGGLGIDNVL